MNKLKWGGFLLPVVAWIFYHYFHTWDFLHTDKYYHLAIAQLWATHGPIDSLEAAQNIAWHTHFYDKEFLQHLLSWPAYEWGGEAGVEWTFRLFSLGIGFFLFYFCTKKTKSLEDFYLAIPVFLLNPPFIHRTFMVRPHLLSLILLMGLVLALTKKNKWAIFFCVLYPLAYQTLYLPIIALGIFALVNFYYERKVERKVLFCLLGLGLGVLLHPDSLSLIKLNWLNIGIAFNNLGLPFFIRPNEFLPLGLGVFLDVNKHVLLAILCAAWLFYKRPDFRKSEATYFFILCLVFAVLSRINARAQIYLVAFAVFLAVEVLSYLTLNKKKKWILIGCVWASSAHLIYLSSFYKKRENHMHNFVLADLKKALAVIPQGGRPKVFNCNWGDGSYILYLRPDLAFVDLSDPYLIYEHDERLGKIKTQLYLGKYPRPYTAIKNDFKASYTLCPNQSFNQRLGIDSRFRPVYPPHDEIPHYYTVYKLY